MNIVSEFCCGVPPEGGGAVPHHCFAYAASTGIAQHAAVAAAEVPAGNAVSLAPLFGGQLGAVLRLVLEQEKSFR